MNINNGNFTSIEQMAGTYLQSNPAKRATAPKEAEASFGEVLKSISVKQEEAQELKFSRHANERLLSRQIRLSEEQMSRLNSGTDRARQKGIQESLIIVDNLAFIVNIKNNPVVTAMGENDSKVFTNIDGAVFS